jgi:site-specific DNA recombinase
MRAAIYCRVSSAEQQDNSSLATQEQSCRRYAAERGWTVVAVYADVHTGAELFERPQLTLLREAMRRGEFDVLLVHALDRLSRKQTHQGLILSEAEHAGVRWDSATEDIDDSPQGQILRAVIGGMAEMERLKIAAPTRRGIRARAEGGKLVPDCRPLYGYRWRDDQKSAYDLDPGASTIVKRIYADFLEGKSLRSIGQTLTNDMVPTSTGRAILWSPPTLSAILKNPVYTGCAAAFRYETQRQKGGATRVTVRPEAAQVALPAGTVPAIVTVEQHEAALTRLEHNRAVAVRNNKNPEATLLRAGFARCGYCCETLSAKHPSENHCQATTYRCNGVNKDRAGCPPVSIKASDLDEAVWRRAVEVLSDPRVIAAEVERRRGKSNGGHELALIEQRLTAIDRQRQNLVRAIGLLTDDDSVGLMTQELTTLSSQRKELERERQAKMAALADREAEDRRLTDLAAWCSRTGANLGSLTYDERRMVLSALGVRVRVWQTAHDPRWEIEMAPLPVETEPSIVFKTTSGSSGTATRS